MRNILAWPKTVWLAGRRINHFLIAEFDENRAVYCFVWFPLALIGLMLSALLCLMLHQAIGGAAALVFLAPIYIVFYLPWAGLFFLSFLLIMQAYIGLFTNLSWPLFVGFERLCAELVGMFRGGPKSQIEPNRQS